MSTTEHPATDKGSVMDHLGNRPVESSAWIERMVWRTVFLILFILGLIMFVASDGNLIFMAFVLGGLLPGLFLMAREQGERHIEAQRRALGPESRHDDELPPLRGGPSARTAPIVGPARIPRPSSDYRLDEGDYPEPPDDADHGWRT